MRQAAARTAMRDHDISQRRACRFVCVDPKAVRRDKPPDNPEVREQMKAIGAVRRRFGHLRIGVLLQPKGMIMFPKKLEDPHRGKAGRQTAKRSQACAWITNTDAGGFAP